MQKGFTLIELIMVIVLIGILGSVVIPRFWNITDEAHQVSVNSTANAIGAAVAIAHAKWLASGQPISENKPQGIDINNTGHINVGFNANGWPIAANSGIQDLQSVDVLGKGGDNNLICARIMRNLLSTNTISFGGGEKCGQDYCAFYKSASCVYQYQSNQKVKSEIIYSIENGNVIKNIRT